MPSIERVLDSTQPGLMLMPSHGAFLIAWLEKPAESDPVLAALRKITAVFADGRRVLAGVNGALWSRWTGQVPPGAPPANPLLGSDSHFRDSGGDLFLYVKGDSAAAVDELLAATEKELEGLLKNRSITRAAMPPDGKILDQHFTDGLTSPTDPASVVDLSVVGVQVLSTTILRPNQKVRISIPNEEFVMRFRGAIAWAKFELPKPNDPPRYRAGVDFADADAAALDEYCLKIKI